MKYSLLLLTTLSVALIACDEKKETPKEFISFDYTTEERDVAYFQENIKEAYDMAMKCHRELLSPVRLGTKADRDRWNKTITAANCRNAQEAWNNRDMSIKYEWYHPPVGARTTETKEE